MNLDLLNDLILVFFKHQFILKMYHFQTESYGAHKASDSYLDTFLDNLDKFFEIAQGIYGKLTLKKVHFNFNTLNDSNINNELNSFIDFLERMKKNINNSDLLNIIDEMLGNVNQFKYLLTFK